MKYSKNNPPPDLHNYSLIDSKEGGYYRRRRGLGGKPAVIPDAVVAQSKLTKISSPAAAKLRRELDPYLEGMQCGRLTVKLSSLIRKGLKAGTWPDYGLMQDLDFQPGYMFGKLIRTNWKLEQDENYVTIRIPIPEGGALEIVNNKLVSSYRFTLVMLTGDPVGDGELLTMAAKSKEYKIGKADKECVLRLAKPETDIPRLLCLRVTSYESKEQAVHGRHSGMVVLAWG